MHVVVCGRGPSPFPAFQNRPHELFQFVKRNRVIPFCDVLKSWTVHLVIQSLLTGREQDTIPEGPADFVVNIENVRHSRMRGIGIAVLDEMREDICILRDFEFKNDDAMWVWSLPR